MLFDIIIDLIKCWLSISLPLQFILLFILFDQIPFIPYLQPSYLTLRILFTFFRWITNLPLLLQKSTPHCNIPIAKTRIFLHIGGWWTSRERIITASILLTPRPLLTLTGRIQTFLEMPILPTPRIPRQNRFYLPQVLVSPMGRHNDRGHRINHWFPLCRRNLHLNELEHVLLDVSDYRADFC